MEEQSIPAPENNIDEVTETVAAVTVDETPPHLRPRLCHIKKWPDFQGYGFNLHAERDRPGQYIGKIDDDSPAEAGGLKEGDRIIEINDANIENETHQQVIARVKAGGNETKMLVVDKEADDYYKNKGVQVSSSLPEVIFLVNPDRTGRNYFHTYNVHVPNTQERERERENSLKLACADLSVEIDRSKF